MKNNANQPLDGLFRQLGDHESTPPSAGWAQMEALLDAQQGKRKRGFVWYWVAAAILPLFLVAGWFLIPSEPELAKNQPIENSIENTNTQPKQLDEVASTNSDVENQVPYQKKVEELSGGSPIKTRVSSQSKGNGSSENEIPLVEQMVAVEKNLPDFQEEEKNSIAKPIVSEVVAQVEVPVFNSNSDLASVEFRPGISESESDEIASIEWKKGASNREKIKNAVQKIRSGDFESLPTVAQAKENLFALIAHSK